MCYFLFSSWSRCYKLIRMSGDGARKQCHLSVAELQKGKVQHQDGQCISKQEMIVTLYSTGKGRAEAVSVVAYHSNMSGR